MRDGANMGRWWRVALTASFLHLACGSSSGTDAGRTDARTTDSSEARGDDAPDLGGDSPLADAAEEQADTTDETGNVSDGGGGEAADAVDNDAEAGTGCGLNDGVWSAIPVAEWSYGFRTAWSTGPSTFLFFDSQNPLRRWNGSKSVDVPVQPPPPPFLHGYTIRGSGENDIWLGGSGPWIRPGVTDRMDVDVTHWDGTRWNDLTLVIPVSPALPTSTGATTYGNGAAAFWAVGPDEAWQWVATFYPGNTSNPYVAYHLEASSWKATPSPLDSFESVPVTMWGSSKTDVWAGGYDLRTVPSTTDGGASTTATYPLLLHWDGMQWTQVALPVAGGDGQGSVSSIWGSAANDVWAVGAAGASADTWHFDGDHWTETPIVGSQSFGEVWGTGPGDFWAVAPAILSNQDRVWRFDGHGWSATMLPQGMHTTGHVTGSGPGDVWVSAQTPQTCMPYEQGPYPIELHWAKSRCGDGVVACDETCDPPRTSGDGLRCDDTCHRPRCGNGVTDPGEDCDPPNKGDGLQCDETCHRPTCGDGVLEAGEQCDPPMAGSCDQQCHSVPAVCGDGIQEPGEACDLSDPSHTLCTSTCTEPCFWNCELGHPLAQLSCSPACSGFKGADFGRCRSLLSCIIGVGCVTLQFAGDVGGASPGCFCKDSTCQGGTADGPCAAEARALLAGVDPSLDTSDPKELLHQLDGPTLINRIGREAAAAYSAPTTGCRLVVCVGKP
jgi:hypothetical protein